MCALTTFQHYIESSTSCNLISKASKLEREYYLVVNDTIFYTENPKAHTCTYKHMYELEPMKKTERWPDTRSKFKINCISIDQQWITGKNELKN